MNILYVGSLEETACATFYLKALTDLGHTVSTFDPKAFSTTGLVEKFLVRIGKSPTPEKIKSIGESLIQTCKAIPFDLIFVVAENFIPDVFDEIRTLRKPAPRFLYHSHDNNFSQGILKPSHFFQTLRKYDAVFTTKSQNVDRYRALGTPNAYFVPSAFEPSYHRPATNTRAPVNVSFVGTYDYSRDKFLDAIGWDELFIWGNNWKRYEGFREHRDHITPHAIYLQDYADVVSHSKVSLGLLREEAEDLHTQRTFEIPACGSLQIAPRNSEILTFFDENKEILCFSSPEELKDKVAYYLQHEAQRAQIAKAGYERCLKGKHTYQDRVKSMLEKTVS